MVKHTLCVKFLAQKSGCVRCANSAAYATRVRGKLDLIPISSVSIVLLVSCPHAPHKLTCSWYLAYAAPVVHLTAHALCESDASAMGGAHQ